MIMNLIASNVHNEDLCSKILNSHEVVDALESSNVPPIENQMESLNFIDNPDIKSSERNDSFIFKMQNIEHIERGVHCTKGI